MQHQKVKITVIGWKKNGEKEWKGFSVVFRRSCRKWTKKNSPVQDHCKVLLENMNLK
jgi:hypothetical protein